MVAPYVTLWGISQPYKTAMFFKAHPFRVEGSVPSSRFSLLDVVSKITVTLNMPPQTPNRLEKTTTSRSPQTHDDIDSESEDNHKTHRIYQIQNCGTVYVDSSNAHGVRMENCSNNVPQVTCSLSYLFFFPSRLTSYYSDHHPRIIGNERALHSQSRTVFDGMWTLAPSSIKHVEYVFLPLGPRNATEPQTEVAKSNPTNVHLQTTALSPSQPISPSHFSGDHTHLEQLLDSSLATVAVVQFSGSTMADVLTPRAYDTIKALYALAALDALSSRTKPTENEIATPSTFSYQGNGCPYLSSRSPLAVPHTVKMHRNKSISMDYVVLISFAGLVAVFCVIVFFNLNWLCRGERIFKVNGLY